MSSLLQFSGQTSRRGVRLEFYRTAPFSKLTPDIRTGSRDGYPICGDLAEPEVPCGTCGRSHPRLWTAWRKPAGTFGPWVQFRYCGETHAPDLSVPIAVFSLPRDAEPLSPAENAAAWHSS